jgi:hypothetical protein
MWWLWIVGPILVSIIYAVTAGRDRRIEAEAERFRAKLPDGAKKISVSLPGPLHRMVPPPAGRAGAADRLSCPSSPTSRRWPRTAVPERPPDRGLQPEDAAPCFSVRPLPIVEGERVVNTGVDFKKDPEFMAAFLTEATTGPGSPLTPAPPPSAELSKKIRGFLSRPIRDALRELPDAWLRVEDKAFALTIYGPVDADRIKHLVSVADVIFAEYGAGGGPSLFGEDDDEDDDEEEAEAAAPPPAKKSKPGRRGREACARGG